MRQRSRWQRRSGQVFRLPPFWAPPFWAPPFWAPRSRCPGHRCLRTLLRRVLGALVTSVDLSAPAAVDSAPVLSAPVPLSSGSRCGTPELEILSTVVPAVAPDLIDVVVTWLLVSGAEAVESSEQAVMARPPVPHRPPASPTE